MKNLKEIRRELNDIKNTASYVGGTLITIGGIVIGTSVVLGAVNIAHWACGIADKVERWTTKN